jgi:hypothetical protein
MSVRSASRAGASLPGPRVERPGSVLLAAGRWTEVPRYKQRQVPPGLLCVGAWINPPFNLPIIGLTVRLRTYRFL